MNSQENSNQISSPTIKNAETCKATQELRISLDNCMIGKLKHNCRQQALNTQTNNSNAPNTSSCVPLPHKKMIKASTLNNITKDIVDLEEMKLLNVRIYEEQHVNSPFNKDEVMSDSMINLQRHDKRKLREKCRNELLEGVPVENVHMFRHYFSNKPMVCALFKIDPSHKAEQIAQGIKMATECVPVCVTKHQKKKVK